MRLRNRIIKADFYTDPDLLQWPRGKRDFYRSLWAMAEDSYCIEDSPFGWKVTAWPSPLDTDMSVEQFGVWRDELIAENKLIQYESGGKQYLFLPDMARHESPRNPQSPNLPLPEFVEWVPHASDQRKGSYRVDTTVVQGLYNDPTTVPALPCPALPRPKTFSPNPAKSAALDDEDSVDVIKCSEDLKTLRSKHSSISTTKEADPKATEMAALLHSLMSENFKSRGVSMPKSYRPDTWARDIEKIHRIDGYEWETIEEVIKWSQADEFWSQNILSGGKLRAKMPQLVMKSREPKKVREW